MISLDIWVCGGDNPPQKNRFIYMALLSVALLAQATGAMADEYSLGGGFTVAAGLEASAIRAENYFYSRNDPVSASGYKIRPSLGIARNGGSNRISLNADAEHANFDLPGDLDHYFDYSLSGDFVWQPFSRHRFDLSGKFRRGHDPVGLQRTEAGPDFSAGAIDAWDQDSGHLTYHYGTAESLGRNTLRVGQSERRYVKNRDQTVFLDFRTRSLDYELAYEYSPKTAFVINLSGYETDYARPVLSTLGNRNGNTLRARAGIRWAATGKTSGEVLLGVRDYSFDERMRPSRRSLSWKANVTWVPTATTDIKLFTGEATTETFRADTFVIEEKTVGLSWQQTWSSRFTTYSGARYVRSDFVGSSREDEYIAADVGFDFRLARQLTAFGQYLSRNRDSNVSSIGYDAPESRLGLRWSL